MMKNFILCHNADFYVIDHAILPLMLYMQLIFLYNDINKAVKGTMVCLSVGRIGDQWNDKYSPCCSVDWDPVCKKFKRAVMILDENF